MIEVRLLGPPRVEVSGTAVGFDTRKAVALLAFLAMSELPRPRDLLADLLWGGDTQHARGALRRTLSTIRAGVDGDLLEADRSTVSLRRGPDVQVDVWRVRDAVASGDLELAASLHGGAFLEGLVVAGAPEFEQWQQTTAETVRAEQAGLLRRLVALREERGDLPGALDAARRWLALDDLHEPAHQTVIRLTALSGDRSGALTRYRDCVRILDHELGVAPLAETTALYEAVRNATLDVSSPEPPAPVPARQPTGPAGLTPLVGRGHVLEMLLQSYREADRHGRVLVVEGEAGIGKTRLVEEMLSRLEGRGAVTVAGRAFEEESSLAYAPVAQALRARLLQGGAGASSSATTRDTPPAGSCPSCWQDNVSGRRPTPRCRAQRNASWPACGRHWSQPRAVRSKVAAPGCSSSTTPSGPTTPRWRCWPTAPGGCGTAGCWWSSPGAPRRSDRCDECWRSCSAPARRACTPCVGSSWATSKP